MELRGKQIIVTGGVKGLGRAMVEELVSRECNVTVFDIDVAGFDELQKAGVRCVACDVTNYEQVNAAVEEFNGVPDVLINNAGILYSEPLIRITEDGLKLHAYESWDRVLRTNLNSVFYMTAPVVAKMVTTRTKGVVVNIGSVSAAGNPGASAYSAAKAAVHALTQAWAKELGPMGIRVIAIAPGFMDTDSAHASTSEAALRETIKRVPLRRLGKAEEVAAAVVAAIENDFFNGKVFELDGGLIV
ncbi:MAG TPA: SDR family NAD(P)-dependent oxidoreductase [Pyrinomonadaceae bacterium]|nr:SDR family NAD(P)-dependent oxidoreductase [Pyrinomonadaceae bacterium]